MGSLGSLEFLKESGGGGGGGGNKMLFVQQAYFGGWDWLYFAGSFAASVICSATVFPTQKSPAY